ncbi:hypothetical protein CO008_02435 [Candidatus Roizmanbacteria bacterium CG_4_8_14_3_um_filter_36_12]|nr:MAG: hypothetical protein CO008_02435 [Candidatus Roizmanbacteria bacterium CG_4_8_14_3_um_filter_36_12]
MVEKIKSNNNFQFSIFNFHLFIWLLVIGLLVYSRFINLGWGLPYQMHPDERNMATALQGLRCVISNFRECGNPHFFAYGQFPLYLVYFLIAVVRCFRDFGMMKIDFQEAIVGLRFISALASIISAFVLLKIIKLLVNRHFERSEKSNLRSLATLGMTAGAIIFSPYAIQFAHFGTTESLLMLFYSLIVFYSLKGLENNKRSLAEFTLSKVEGLGMTGVVCGLAIATKASSIIFLAIPIIVIMSKAKRKIILTFAFLLLTLLSAIIFSPHNLLNWHEFIGSMKYESDVALGRYTVFYTRQFVNSIPVLFQLIKVFPYALGWPVFILGMLGVLGGVGWRDKKVNLLRFAFLVYFLPNAFLFAKWTRFMAPVFPIMTIFAILFAHNVISSTFDKLSVNSARNLSERKLRFTRSLVVASLLLGMTGGAIIPGISYLSIYQNPDVRFQSSEWIYKNIPENSYILSETANVVDIPIISQKSRLRQGYGGQAKVKSQNYQIISFNFYDLDENPQLQEELREHLKKADYIFVPSRRIFANHPKQKYPKLNQYYSDLFNGKLGFEKAAEFSAGLNDEQAEETWTVFDHPVIRIYKRISNVKSQISNPHLKS